MGHLQRKMNTTIDYYNRNASDFTADTQFVEFEQIQDRFTGKLPAGGRILDFGCGSGRDTKHFIKCGFSVDAVDGSEKMCEIASAFTGITVRKMMFQELDAIEAYDGIWACASILHLPKEELKNVIARMRNALRADGIIYTSFKYGRSEGMCNERYFTDFTEDTFKHFLANVRGMTLEEYWITGDARPGREEEKWLNLILRKSNIA